MGNPHAGFDEAEAGNGPVGTASAFDPTLGGKGAERLPTYPVFSPAKLDSQNIQGGADELQ